MSDGQEVERFDALLTTARRLANGNTREMTGVSMDQMREVAALAAIGGDTMKLAADVVIASDTGAPRDAIKKSLEILADHIRPYIGRE